jgi:hypothetical protein
MEILLLISVKIADGVIMIKRFFHTIFGCYGFLEKHLGFGYGVYDQKKNRPPLYTKEKHDFYKCRICGAAVMM